MNEEKMDFNFVNYQDYKSEQFKKVFTEYYKHEGVTLKPDTTVFDEIEQSAQQGKTLTYAVMEQDNIVAFIMFQVLTLKSDNKFVKQKLGHIEELYVVKQKRNQKIATQLLVEVEKYFKSQNIDIIFLTAEPHVFEFYRKLGFKHNNTYNCANNLQCLTKDI